MNIHRHIGIHQQRLDLDAPQPALPPVRAQVREVPAENAAAAPAAARELWAAVQIGKRIGRGCVVTVACDRGDRYFEPLRWEKPKR